MARIVISGPPKQGHRWLRCLFGSIYQLKQLGGSQTPEMKPEAVREWAEQGGFPENSIFHQHARFTPELCDAIEAVPAHIVTPVRDPYDVFVSLYYWAQYRDSDKPEKKKVRARSSVVDKPLDHPDVLAFLERDFRAHLRKSDRWLHGGRGTVIRYEDLHRDPIAALTRATDKIQPVPPERIAAAVEECKAENMRQKSANLAKHVRVAKVGDSRDRLSEKHLAIFRDRYADLIQSLGYEVR